MDSEKLSEQFNDVDENIRRLDNALRTDDEVLNGNIDNSRLERVANLADECFKETDNAEFEEIATHLRNMKTE